MRFILIMLMCIAVSCTTKKIPEVVLPGPEVIETSTSLTEIADTSLCARYKFKNRSVAPKSYVRGMVKMYARQLCGMGSEFIKSSGYYDSRKDVLSWYNLQAGELSTFTILHGLGMRESSGKHCTGRDRSANWVKASNAEAGLFQVAYVSRVFNHQEFSRIYEEYKTGKKSCLLETFSKGVNCRSHDAKTWGNGEGTVYQKLSKNCPAFAVEWGSVLIRSQMRHFGPLIRKEAEYLKSCENMYKSVEKLVNEDRSICSKL